MAQPARSRPFTGSRDLERMQAALSAAWLARRPWVNTGVGDLEWWMVLGGPEADWATRIRVWPGEDDTTGGAVRAYAWRNAADDLDWHQRWDLTPDDRGRLVDEALDWAVRSALEEADAGAVAAPERLTAWALDADLPMAAILRDRGFEPDPEPAYTHWYRRLAAAEPVPGSPEVPAGYRVRHVVLPDDLEARVEVHCAAFAPSRMSAARYRLLAAQRHYDPRRDMVVEAPGGGLAAFANAWLDPVARTGELEPVGTHPDHRRMGLGLAACAAALAALRDAGAEDCTVLSQCSNAASERLYERAGFAPVSHHRAWRRPFR